MTQRQSPNLQKSFLQGKTEQGPVSDYTHKRWVVILESLSQWEGCSEKAAARTLNSSVYL